VIVDNILEIAVTYPFSQVTHASITPKTAEYGPPPPAPAKPERRVSAKRRDGWASRRGGGGGFKIGWLGWADMALGSSGTVPCDTCMIEQMGVKLAIFGILVSWGVRAF